MTTNRVRRPGFLALQAKRTNAPVGETPAQQRERRSMAAFDAKLARIATRK